MDLLDYYKQLYEYQAWANRRSLSAAFALSEEQLNQKIAGHADSIMDILRHMVSAEWLWLQRCQGESPSSFLDPTDLTDLTVLQERWGFNHKNLMGFLEAQTPESLNRIVDYHTTKGVPHRLRLWQILGHLANHGTHHRGELAALFAHLGISHQEEDWLLFFLLNEEQL